MKRSFLAFVLVFLLTVVFSGCAEPESSSEDRVEISEISNRITMAGTDKVSNVSFVNDSLVVKGQIVTFSHGRVPVISNYSYEKGVFEVTVGTEEGEGPTGASENEASIYKMEIKDKANISRLVVRHDMNMNKTVFNSTLER